LGSIAKPRDHVGVCGEFFLTAPRLTNYDPLIEKRHRHLTPKRGLGGVAELCHDRTVCGDSFGPTTKLAEHDTTVVEGLRSPRRPHVRHFGRTTKILSREVQLVLSV